MLRPLGRTLALAALGLTAGALWVGTRHHAPSPPAPPLALPAPPPPEPTPAPPEEEETDEDPRAFSFRVPSGEPTMLSCAEARRIVEQVRTGLAYEPDAVSPRPFAEATADWLDPHELWALAADAPTAPAVEAAARALLAAMEGRTSDECVAALAVGETLEPWVGELRGLFDGARAAARAGGGTLDALREPLLGEDGARVTAREMARSIGRRAGTVEAFMGETARGYGDAARRRFFPELDAAGWSRVVLAAAVRAYVPLVDPHGAWAPFDEEASVYEVELAAHPPERLWQSGDFTALGFRVRDGAATPFAKGDVVLAIDGLPVAGLPLEQLDQLAFASAAAHHPVSAVVVREGETATRALSLGAPDDPPAGAHERDPLPAERVRFGEGDALVVTIKDIRDDLGDELTRAVRGAASEPGRAIAGVVLDLRGNGGGSTDGAIDALGLFLPGAPLFPMRRRDGTIETDRAPEPTAADRWEGPVATLVDGATASAAEMIAGALSTYHRGPSVGAPTYGKGCAQEYVDDDARAGVLRMTTLLYALPDGAPVQRVGLFPSLRVPFAAVGGEREASLPHAPPTWRGPDVRLPGDEPATHAWPAHGGAVGPCHDGDVCRALRALGAPARRAVAAAKR